MSVFANKRIVELFRNPFFSVYIKTARQILQTFRLLTKNLNWRFENERKWGLGKTSYKIFDRMSILRNWFLMQKLSASMCIIISVAISGGFIIQKF